MNSDLDNYGNDASYSTLPKIPPSIPQAPPARPENDAQELYPLVSDPEGRN
jgi:hypothetical protein